MPKIVKRKITVELPKPRDLSKNRLSVFQRLGTKKNKIIQDEAAGTATIGQLNKILSPVNNKTPEVASSAAISVSAAILSATIASTTVNINNKTLPPQQQQQHHHHQHHHHNHHHQQQQQQQQQKQQQLHHHKNNQLPPKIDQQKVVIDRSSIIAHVDLLDDADPDILEKKRAELQKELALQVKMDSAIRSSQQKPSNSNKEMMMRKRKKIQQRSSSSSSSSSSESGSSSDSSSSSSSKEPRRKIRKGKAGKRRNSSSSSDEPQRLKKIAKSKRVCHKKLDANKLKAAHAKKLLAAQQHEGKIRKRNSQSPPLMVVARGNNKRVMVSSPSMKTSHRVSMKNSKMLMLSNCEDAVVVAEKHQRLKELQRRERERERESGLVRSRSRNRDRMRSRSPQMKMRGKSNSPPQQMRRLSRSHELKQRSPMLRRTSPKSRSGGGSGSNMSMRRDRSLERSGGGTPSGLVKRDNMMKPRHETSRERERDRREQLQREREALRIKERQELVARCQQRERERERLAREKMRKVGSGSGGGGGGGGIDRDRDDDRVSGGGIKSDRLLPRPAERAMALAAARDRSRDKSIDERDHHHRPRSHSHGRSIGGGGVGGGGSGGGRIIPDHRDKDAYDRGGAGGGSLYDHRDISDGPRYEHHNRRLDKNDHRSMIREDRGGNQSINSEREEYIPMSMRRHDDNRGRDPIDDGGYHHSASRDKQRPNERDDYDVRDRSNVYGSGGSGAGGKPHRAPSDVGDHPRYGGDDHHHHHQHHHHNRDDRSRPSASVGGDPHQQDYGNTRGTVGGYNDDRQNRGSERDRDWGRDADTVRDERPTPFDRHHHQSSGGRGDWNDRSGGGGVVGSEIGHPGGAGTSRDTYVDNREWVPKNIDRNWDSNAIGGVSGGGVGGPRLNIDHSIVGGVGVGGGGGGGGGGNTWHGTGHDQEPENWDNCEDKDWQDYNRMPQQQDKHHHHPQQHQQQQQQQHHHHMPSHHHQDGNTSVGSGMGPNSNMNTPGNQMGGTVGRGGGNRRWINWRGRRGNQHHNTGAGGDYRRQLTHPHQDNLGVNISGGGGVGGSSGNGGGIVGPGGGNVGGGGGYPHRSELIYRRNTQQVHIMQGDHQTHGNLAMQQSLGGGGMNELAHSTVILPIRPPLMATPMKPLDVITITPTPNKIIVSGNLMPSIEQKEDSIKTQTDGIIDTPSVIKIDPSGKPTPIIGTSPLIATTPIIQSTAPVAAVAVAATTTVSDAGGVENPDGIDEIIPDDLSEISDDADEILNQQEEPVLTPTTATTTNIADGSPINPVMPNSAPSDALLPTPITPGGNSGSVTVSGGAGEITDGTAPITDSIDQQPALIASVKDIPDEIDLDFEEISDGELEEEARIRGLGDALGVDWASLVEESKAIAKEKLSAIKDSQTNSAKQRWQPHRILLDVGVSFRMAGKEFATEVLYAAHNKLLEEQKQIELERSRGLDDSTTTGESIASDSVKEEFSQPNEVKNEIQEGGGGDNNCDGNGDHITDKNTKNDLTNEQKTQVLKNVKKENGKPIAEQSTELLIHPIASVQVASRINAETRRKLVYNVTGPFSRALCKRRDIQMRRQLCGLPVKDLFTASAASSCGLKAKTSGGGGGGEGGGIGGNAGGGNGGNSGGGVGGNPRGSYAIIAKQLFEKALAKVN